MSEAPSRTAWIIGGGSGIGAAMARLLASRGWRVAISGRRADRLAEVASGSRLIAPYPLDVTDAIAVQAVLQQVVADLGRIDLYVFGAATWQPLTVGDYDFAKFQRLVDTNLMGFVRMANPVVAQMTHQGGGQLAVIASVAGYFGLPRAAAYNATKGALINLLQTMRTELEPRGIRVRMIAPGFFKSELTAKNDFPMPFLMETEAAAQRAVDGLLGSTRFEIAFPRRLVWLLKLMRMLPYPLFFAITRMMMPKR
ncbi:SDR family NAD(P)-dependent oxidoreductase [Devosia sp.]|uniref:SDR family NAD(P)-dependent oxidoreductase n=1 Tax=Devosia sp. TaxID=1871048 RepID=UPI0035AE8AB6